MGMLAHAPLSIPLGCLLALAGPAGAQTHAALTRLTPLPEVYATARPTPEFDVAGIRCAALVLAQDDWARARGGERRASARAMRDAQHNLTASEITRRNRGQSYAAAMTSTRDDARRVHALYIARFAQNAEGAGHPWRGDPVITADTTYCGFLNNR